MPYKLFGVRRVIGWVPDTATTLGAAISDTTGVSITLASGGGAAFSTASPSNPHKIMVDSEIMWVTARAADVLTVIRGQDGSTAATHLTAAAVTHKFPQRIVKSNSFTMDANIDTLEFPGDGDVEQVFESAGVSGVVGTSKWDPDFLRRLAGTTPQTTGLNSDEATRYYPEIGTYPAFQLDVDYKAINEIDGTRTLVRCTVWKATLQRPVTPGDAGNNEPQLAEYSWGSEAVTSDMWGRPLQGVGAQDVHYSMSELVAA